MKRARKSNRVSWAPGFNLCQVYNCNILFSKFNSLGKIVVFNFLVASWIVTLYGSTWYDLSRFTRFVPGSLLIWQIPLLNFLFWFFSICVLMATDETGIITNMIKKNPWREKKNNSTRSWIQQIAIYIQSTTTCIIILWRYLFCYYSQNSTQ